MVFIKIESEIKCPHCQQFKGETLVIHGIAGYHCNHCATDWYYDFNST